MCYDWMIQWAGFEKFNKANLQLGSSSSYLFHFIYIDSWIIFWARYTNTN